MKGMVWAGLLSLALTSFASATPTIRLTSGANSVTVADGQVGTLMDYNPLAGTVTYFASNLNGWTIGIVSGTSKAPTLRPFGLDLAALVATCYGGACTGDPLRIQLSDTGFTEPVAGFETDYSSTQTGGGATTESAYVDFGNTLFAETTLIGTVGPLSGSAAFAGGANALTFDGSGPYSLTIDEVFYAAGSSDSFSTDGNITANPEPSTLALFGSALLLCAARLRKRLV
jgi:hypothetical protein